MPAYEKLKRWPTLDFIVSSVDLQNMEIFGGAPDFLHRKFGVTRKVNGENFLFLKVGTQETIDAVKSRSKWQFSFWAWAYPLVSALEMQFPFDTGEGKLQSAYLLEDPQVVDFIKNLGCTVCLYRNPESYVILKFAESNYSDHLLDIDVLRDFLSWSARETDVANRGIPFDVTFWDVLKQVLSKSQVNKVVLSDEDEMRYEWSQEFIRCYKLLRHHWTDEHVNIEKVNQYLRDSGFYRAFTELSFLSGLNAGLSPVEACNTILKHLTHTDIYPVAVRALISIAEQTNEQLTTEAKDAFGQFLIDVIGLLNVSPVITNCGISRVVYGVSKEGTDIAKMPVKRLRLDPKYVEASNPNFWASLSCNEFIGFAEVLNESDIPMPIKARSEDAKSLMFEAPIESVREGTLNNLMEIRLARKWAIPFGARVEVKVGQFYWLEVYDLGGELLCLYRDRSERYFPVTLQVERNCKYSAGELYKLGPRENDIYNTEAAELLCFIASCVVRDFLVVEERQSVFQAQGRRIRTGRNFKKELQIIYIPRVRYTNLNSEAIKYLKDEAPKRSLHDVASHLRKAENASIAQITLASRYGIKVPKGYTFVRPHQRGLEEFRERQVIYRSRSVSKMLFAVEAASSVQSTPEWFKFERDTESLMQKRSYEILQRETRGAGDGGVDIKAFDPKSEQLVIVQCKCYSPSHPIGPEKMREFIGTLAIQEFPTQGVYVTTSTFSSGAASLAIENGIEIIDGSRFHELTKV